MNLASSIGLHAGGPGSGCHGPNCGRPSEEGGKNEHGLQKLLQQVTTQMSSWRNLWGDLARHGHPGNTEPFSKEEQAKLKALKVSIGQCKVGYCVMNAQKLAIAALHDPAIQYVEGLVTVHGVPIDHAWIELNGKVYDPTLADEKWKMKPGRSGKGEYFGIVVPKDEIMKYQVKTWHYSFLSHDRADESLRKKIWK